MCRLRYLQGRSLQSNSFVHSDIFKQLGYLLASMPIRTAVNVMQTAVRLDARNRKSYPTRITSQSRRSRYCTTILLLPASQMITTSMRALGSGGWPRSCTHSLSHGAGFTNTCWEAGRAGVSTGDASQKDYPDRVDSTVRRYARHLKRSHSVTTHTLCIHPPTRVDLQLTTHAQETADWPMGRPC